MSEAEDNNARAGSLQTVRVPRNWLRSARRFPVIVSFSDGSARGYRKGGGQADIIVYTGDGWLTNNLTGLWIGVASLMSCVY